MPAYLYFFGIDWFQIVLFFVMFCACGFSITVGYHRLYSHLTFQAHWIVRLFTLIFGAGAFENSALLWACEHRTHHKHVDHDEDPYCISKGFFHAHIGWLMFKLNPVPPFDNVADLQKDPLVLWQHRYIHWIGTSVAFVVSGDPRFCTGVVGFRLSAHSSLREWHVSSSFSTVPFASIRCATTSAIARILPNAARAIRGSWRSSPSAKATITIITSFSTITATE